MLFLFLLLYKIYYQSDAARLYRKRIRAFVQFVEFVNTKSDFAFEVDKIIERNKWTKLFGNEFCFDGKRKLFFKDSNTAFVVDNQFSKIFKSMTLIKGILI